MEIFIMVVLSNILIISLLFYSKIYIDLKYWRKDSNDEFIISVYILNRLLVYNVQIPAVEFTSTKEAFFLKYKTKSGEKHNKILPKREQIFFMKDINFYVTHPRSLRRIFRVIRYLSKLYYRVMGNITTSLCCKKIRWVTIYGADDATITGIVTGVLWTIKSLIITRLKKDVVFMDKPIINVKPIFGTDTLKIDFQCIFSVRVGNIMNTIRNLYMIK